MQDSERPLHFCVQGVWFHRQLLAGSGEPFGARTSVQMTWVNFPRNICFMNVQNTRVFVECPQNQQFWYSQPEAFSLEFRQLSDSLSVARLNRSWLVSHRKRRFFSGNWWYAIPFTTWETRSYREDSRSFQDWGFIPVDNSSSLSRSWICKCKLLPKPEPWALHLTLSLSLELLHWTLYWWFASDGCCWKNFAQTRSDGHAGVFQSCSFFTTATNTFLLVVQKGTCQCFSSCSCSSVSEGCSSVAVTSRFLQTYSHLTLQTTHPA